MRNLNFRLVVSVFMVAAVAFVFSFSMTRRYAIDGNITELKKKAVFRELAISSGRSINVPQYEIFKGARELGHRQILFAINNTNKACWVSSFENNPLIIAFALDCDDDDEHTDRFCNTYVLVGNRGYKFKSGTNEVNSVLRILSEHNGDLGLCNIIELLESFQAYWMGDRSDLGGVRPKREENKDSVTGVTTTEVNEFLKNLKGERCY